MIEKEVYLTVRALGETLALGIEELRGRWDDELARDLIETARGLVTVLPGHDIHDAFARLEEAEANADLVRRVLDAFDKEEDDD